MEANNMAAMHEALVKIEKMAHCDLCNVYPQYRDKFNDKIGGIEREARAALAKPPRNCDVGTAEEQTRRFEDLCHSHDCCTCPIRQLWNFKPTGTTSCALIWAQMPYTEGGEE